MKTVSAAMLAAAMSVAGGAMAQTCDALPTSQIAPVTFDQAVQSLSSSSAALTKDEFETTAQFEARVAAAGSGAPSTMLISVPVNPEYVTYDADAGAFAIKSYAVANIGADWFTAFYGSPHYSTIEHASYDNLALVLSSDDRATGAYEGQNAYGATWEITRLNRTINAIFESKPPRYGVNLWGNSSANSSPTWSLPVPVDQARAMKDKLRAAVLIAPKAPFFFENSQPSAARITIQNPRDITQISRVIVADIQCMAITDDNNNVLLAVRTN